MISNAQSTSKDNELKSMSTLRAKRDNARIEKWRNMMPKLDEMVEKKDTLLKNRIRKGVPDPFRGKVWPVVARVKVQKEKSTVDYQSLVQGETEYLEDILKDVHRTFPLNPFFAVKGGYGQKSLENVLRALSLSYPRMGYCQGLNFVCAMLVIYCNDEEAYWIMNSMMEQYHLEDYYRDLNTVKKPLFILDGLILQFFPSLGKHLAKVGIEAILYATGWIMTLYANVLPIELVVRLFDSFLYEESKIIFRVALAIMKIKEKAILKCKDMDNVLMLLKKYDEPEFRDEDEFIKIAFGIKLKRSHLDKIGAKYKD